eukprot:TRINITY_DN7540_c4_g1_i2.p1 TRINITY_DN7540_c4_g1~~TRINITY_DN7540_c4_g1_i2.p1  ORF type:complete len:550 (+),score=81.60 TRINITY_DN7540_c4_g1_i2:44-1651(+)
MKKLKSLRKRKGVVFRAPKFKKDAKGIPSELPPTTSTSSIPRTKSIVEVTPTLVKEGKKQNNTLSIFTGFRVPAGLRDIVQTGVDRDIVTYDPAKHSHEYLIRRTGTDSKAALRLAMWNMENSSCGVHKKRIQDGDRAARLFDRLENAGITYDELRSLSGPEKVKLFARLNIQPTERIWITAMMRNKPCGHLILSEDGKHVCLRSGRDGGKCDLHADPSKALPDGATRSDLRAYYGKTIYPLYEIYDEHDMQERLQQLQGADVHINDASHGAVQLSEMMNDIKESKSITGNLPRELSEAAYSCWSYAIDDTPEDMVSVYNEESFHQLSSPLRNYVVELIRVEFDKGSPGDFQRKVLGRREEWAKYFTKMTRRIHEAVEQMPQKSPQDMTPPKIEDLQKGVDGGDSHLKETLTPPGQQDDPVFRSVDPSRSVTQADIPSMMPSIIVKGSLSIADRSRNTTITSSLSLTLDVVIHRDVCFTHRNHRKLLHKKLQRLPHPPAMIPFNALIRVDPLDYILFLDEQKKKNHHEDVPLLHA